MRRPLVLAVLVVASMLLAPLAAMPVAAGSADLHVEQESYVGGEVDVDTRGDVNVYRVRGDRVFVQPQNFDAENVVDHGIEEDEGALNRNEELGVYEFQTIADGTFHVYWDVRQTREEGNETVVETERYEAVIDVSSSDVQTISPARLEELKAQADNWDEWKATVHDISGSGADIQVETQLAANLLNLRRNPVAALTGNFWHYGVLLFGTMAGLMWVLLFGFYNWFDKRKLRKELNEKKAVLPDRGELEEKLAEYDHKDDLQSMVTTRPTDWYDDPYIGQAAVEAHGEDMLTHFSSFEEMLSGISALRDRLRAMAHAGYRARLRRDAGEIVDVALIAPDDSNVATDGGSIAPLQSLDDEDFNDVHRVVDVHDPVLKSFSYEESDADRADLREEGDVPADLNEMLGQMDAEIERFGGDRETYGEYLEAMLSDVIRHPNTDADGVPKSQRFMMEQWYRVAIDARDIFGIPIDFQADIVRDLLAQHNPVEDAQRIADQDRKGEDWRGEGGAGGD